MHALRWRAVIFVNDKSKYFGGTEDSSKRSRVNLLVQLNWCLRRVKRYKAARQTPCPFCSSPAQQPCLRAVHEGLRFKAWAIQLVFCILAQGSASERFWHFLQLHFCLDPPVTQRTQPRLRNHACACAQLLQPTELDRPESTGYQLPTAKCPPAQRVAIEKCVLHFLGGCEVSHWQFTRILEQTPGMLREIGCKSLYAARPHTCLQDPRCSSSSDLELPVCVEEIKLKCHQQHKPRSLRLA